MIVKADSLLPYKKKDVQKTQELDLVEMPREAHSKLLPYFDYERMGNSFLWILGKFVQESAHMATYQCVQQVQVTMLSEPDKLPYLLQAHVAEEAYFKPGELVLSPYGGDLQLEAASLTPRLGRALLPDARVVQATERHGRLRHDQRRRAHDVRKLGRRAVGR